MDGRSRRINWSLSASPGSYWGLRPEIRTRMRSTLVSAVTKRVRAVRVWAGVISCSCRSQSGGPNRRAGGDQQQVVVGPAEAEVHGARSSDLVEPLRYGSNTWTPEDEEA
jgi:hypothetical protein